MSYIDIIFFNKKPCEDIKFLNNDECISLFLAAMLMIFIVKINIKVCPEKEDK
jgi:hypothetical protein